MRRMSMFPSAEPAPLAPTEEALQNEMENGESVSTSVRPFGLVCLTERSLFLILCVTEEQNLVKELVAMSTRERIHAIRDLPMSFEEKKSIRWVGQGCQR